MRILGLDWGEKRIGVAISDPLGITALPLPHLLNNKEIFSNIRDLAGKNTVNEIVVGLPRNMNGTEGASA
jgi:putative holliday junction resolvase